MWELPKALSFGRISVRNTFLFAAAMVVALFASIFILTPTAHAADAAWKDDSRQAITYAQNDYIKEEIQDNDSRFKEANIPDGATVYIYVEPADSNSSNPTKKAHLIYFAPDKDPATATSATHVDYDFTAEGNFENPTGKTTITIDPKATTPSEGSTSCVTEGIGWIICPVTNFMARAMDFLYGVISEFLAVKPPQTNQENALFRSWAYIRNIANVVFVIAFLVIIYSHLTSIGVSNYTLKKMLPRLVIAAILVNISYWICSIMIDVSNILGYSVTDILLSIRNSMVGEEGNGWSELGQWESLTGFILSGGTAAVAGYAAIAAAGGITAALYLLIPILVGVLIAALVALLILAARQAIIVILVILSPLAFVAFVLPNTEKYFEKWKSLGMTMLLIFPMFSVIYGGAQLAGMAIIQTADSINLIILGMAVHVVPLVITPLLIKFSGSLLANIGGFINNPNKGLMDRTRQWAQGKADHRKSKLLARDKKPSWYNLSPVSTARRMDTRRRNLEAMKKAHEASTEANWMKNSKTYGQTQQSLTRSGLIRDASEATAQNAAEALKHTNKEMQGLELHMRASKLKLDASQATTEANWEEVRADRFDNVIDPAALSATALAAHSFTTNEDVQGRRAAAAKHIRQHQIAEALEAQAALRDTAGGIDPNGAQRALASALSDKQKARQETITVANAILDHANFDAGDVLQIAKNNSVGGITVTDDIREAAIKRVMGNGVVPHINDLLTHFSLAPDTEGGNPYFRAAAIEALKGNANRPKYISNSLLNDFVHGIPGGVSDTTIDSWIETMVISDKLSAQDMSTQDKDTLKRVNDAIGRLPRTPVFDDALRRLRTEIGSVKTDERLWNAAGERKSFIDGIENTINGLGI